MTSERGADSMKKAIDQSIALYEGVEARQRSRSKKNNPVGHNSNVAWEKELRHFVVKPHETEKREIDGQVFTFIKSEGTTSVSPEDMWATTWASTGTVRPSNEQILADTIVIDRTGARMSIDRKNREVPEGFHLRCALSR